MSLRGVERRSNLLSPKGLRLLRCRSQWQQHMYTFLWNVILDEVRKFAAKLHAEGIPWKGEVFGWQAEYNPERPESPLDSKMTFTPADFCIGESGIWFFSLMWEHGKHAEPNVLYFQSSLLLAEQMTNNFQIPNRDFGIWAFGHWNFTAVHGPIISINL